MMTIGLVIILFCEQHNKHSLIYYAVQHNSGISVKCLLHYGDR